MNREQLEALMAWVEATVVVQAARNSAGPHLSPLRQQQVAARERLLATVPDELESKIELLEGPIEVGQEFIWEPNEPHARMHIVVSGIVQKVNEETRIWSHSIAETPDDATWNDESRFREACVRVKK